MLRTVEERGVRFIHLWFTDVLGSLKSFAITPAELENAFEEGMTFDGSAIDGFSRHVESDMLAQPDPDTFELLPWRADEPVARMFCDITISTARRFSAIRGRCCGAVSTGRTSLGIPVLRQLRPGVLLLRRQRPVASAPPARHRRRSSISLPPTLPATCADDHRLPRGARHPGAVQPSRGGPEPAGDRPPLHRCPHDGRLHHDVPPGRQGGRYGARRVRNVHAEAHRRRAGFGHAHPPVAVQGRRERVLRRATTSTRCRRWRSVPRRHLAPCPGDHGGHQPVGELVQTSRRRLRGAGLRELGALQPFGAGAGPDTQDGERTAPPESSTARPTRRAIPISPMPCCSRPVCGASSRATNCRRAHRESLRDDPDAGRETGIEQLPGIAVRGR